MPQSLGTTIGQFSSSGGRSQPRAANVRAVEPAADLPGSEHGNLYAFVEVSGSGGGHAALYRQMLNALQTAFYEASGSVSAALTRAVRNAHSVLVRANEALPEATWRAGVSLAAFQGQELLIAQAGPSLALVSHPKTIDQFPAQIGAPRVPLGGAERPEVELFQTTVEPGSMLLLVQSDWLNQVTPEALAVAGTADSIALAGEYLAQLAGGAELSALIVGFNAVAIPEVRDEMAAVSGVPAPWPTAQPLASEGEFEAAYPLRGGAEPSEEVEHPEERPRRSPWPLLVALVIIPVLVGVLILAMWWLRNPRAEQQFKQTLDGAAAILTEVEAMPDENAAVQRLSAAQEFLDKASAMRPDDPQLQALQRRYQEISDRLQHVTPLYGIVPLWDFKETGHDLARVLAGGDSLYVLDTGRNEVYRLILSKLKDSVSPAQQPVVIQKAQQVGDQVISDLVDMTWVEGSGNQRSRLVVLDTSGGLAGYDATYGADKVPIVGQDKWQQPQLLMGYGGNLYILDSKANQIWRYRPSQKGFENAPETYFGSGAQVVLTGVQSMAIDGSVWLLFPDGRLLKYLVGEQQPFELKGLPGSLSGPVDVVAPLVGDYLYIADAGNGRILEFTKEGEYRRQFRARDGDILRDMRSLYLDETAGAFYILTADRLYKANLPEAGPSATPSPTPGQ